MSSTFQMDSFYRTDTDIIACSLLLPGKLGAIALLQLAIVSVYALVLRVRRPAESKSETSNWLSNPPLAFLKLVVIAGLAFQVMHLIEHGLQLGSWVFFDRSVPWLSFWAAEAAVGLGEIADHFVLNAPRALGVELLHLVGNTIFLGAIASWQMAVRKGGVTTGTTQLRNAEIVQSVHVAEHVLLTATLLITGKAIGLSTGFGTVEGTALVALRVWFHFSINAAATWFAIGAAKQQKQFLTKDLWKIFDVSRLPSLRS